MFRRFVFGPADAAAAGGAADEKKPDEKKPDERPLPPSHPPQKNEKPPELAADALAGLSNRVSALEKDKAPTRPGAVLIVLGIAAAVVAVIVIVIVRIARGSGDPTPEK